VTFPPGFLTRNWKLKLAALVLAVLLWTSLRVEALDRQSLPSVPVRVQLNDPNWAQTEEPDPNAVEVHFSGPARELLSLYLERPTVTVPVDEVTAVDTTILLRPEWVRLPNRPGVSVEQIEPQTVRLAFEPIAQAGVPIALRLEGRLPSSVALAEPISVTPEFARVSGPRSRIDRIDSLRLEPLDLSGIRGSTEVRLPVDTSGLSSVVISPSSAEVSFVLEERIERRIPGVPVRFPSELTRLRVEPDTVAVSVSGARSRVEAVAPEDLRVELPADRLDEVSEGEDLTVPLVVRTSRALVSVRAAVDSVTLRIVPEAEGGPP